jgi:hypothetical protein
MRLEQQHKHKQQQQQLVVGTLRLYASLTAIPFDSDEKLRDIFDTQLFNKTQGMIGWGLLR